MASNLNRTQGQVYRFLLASPLAFADWRNPTAAELNANPDNDPHGLVFHLTCALDTDGTVFNLADPEMDDSTSFCQEATDQEPMSDNVEVTYSIFRATEEERNDDPTKWNTSHLAFTLLAWRGVEYFAIMSVGEAPDEPFAIGDVIKMARVATNHGIDEVGTGENIRLNAEMAFRGSVLWNYKVAA